MKRFSRIFCTALFVFSLVYLGGWFALDVATRLGIWPESWRGDQAVSFTASMSLLDNAFFYSGFVLLIVAFALYLRRRALAALVYALSFALSLTDWILLTANPDYEALLPFNVAIFDYGFIIAQLALLGALIVERQTGALLRH